MTGWYLASLALGALFCAPLQAHDVWLAPKVDGKSYELVFGHPGELEGYDPAKVEQTIVIDTSGKRQDINPAVQNGRIEFQTKPDTALIAFYFDHGYWTTGSDRKTANLPKWKIPGYRTSSHIRLFNKNLLAWNATLAAPVGLELEIVPLANPLKLNPGDKLPVQVFYQSRPLAQADVEVMGDTNIYTTDAAGKTTVSIQKTEFQYLYVSHVESTKSSPNVDEMELSSNLIFTP